MSQTKENKPWAWKIVNTLSVTVLEMIDKNDVRCCKLLSHVCKSQTPPLTGINTRKEPQGTNEIESSGREASVATVIDTCISGSELRADIKGKALWGAPCPANASAEVQSPASRESVWETAALPLVSKNDAVYVSFASFDEVFAHFFVSLYVPLQVEQWDIAETRASFVSCLILYLSQICWNLKSYCSLFVIEINSADCFRQTIKKTNETNTY